MTPQNFLAHIQNVANNLKQKEKPQLQPQQLIHPEITTSDHKKTLTRYREYVQKLNNHYEIQNAPYQAYNSKVRKNTLQNPPSTELQKKIAVWRIENKHLAVDAYNKEVKKFNKENGLYIYSKLPHKTIKPVTLQIFEAFLHAYTVQLRRFRSIWQQTNKTYPSPLPKVNINPKEIELQERGKGVKNLNLSERTIRRHRDLLEKIGVLTQKEFRGTTRPNKYAINPEILAVSEAFLSFSQNPENQPPYGEKLTNWQHNKVVQEHFKNNKEIKGTSSSKRSSQAHAFKISFYKTTYWQDAEKNTPAGENSAENEFQNHFSSLPNRQQLAQKLAAGTYNDYAPLPMKKLNEWLSATYVTNDEFLRVCLIDFCKHAAAINKHDQAGVGSWILALEHIEKDFGCVNFAGKAFSKSEILQKLVQFRYIINWALGWFDRRQWTARPYANLYFDPLRKLPTDISWQYAKKVWTKKMKQITKKAAERKRKEADLQRRKAQLSKDRQIRKKMDNAIYRYLRHEIDYNALTEFIYNELPSEYYPKFPDRLEKLKIRTSNKK